MIAEYVVGAIKLEEMARGRDRRKDHSWLAKTCRGLPQGCCRESAKSALRLILPVRGSAIEFSRIWNLRVHAMRPVQRTRICAQTRGIAVVIGLRPMQKNRLICFTRMKSVGHQL